MTVGQAELAKRVNRMYWESDESVNRIAEQLDLSKGALYGMIAPAPADGACPDCASPLSFGNRTARDRGLAECVTCSLGDEPADRVPSRALAAHDPELAAIHEPRRWSGRTVAGSLLLGVVAGVLIVSLLRRR
jgi:hypothetical protein